MHTPNTESTDTGVEGGLQQTTTVISNPSGLSSSNLGGLGGGLGGLSSLSTLSGLIDTASTFKPKKEDAIQNQRVGSRTGESFAGGKQHQGQLDSGRFDEFFKNTGGGRQGGRVGWKGDTRDYGRLRGDGLQKSFAPRSHGTLIGTDASSRLGSGSNEIKHQWIAGTSPSDSASPNSTPAKADVPVFTDGGGLSSVNQSISSEHATLIKQTDDQHDDSSITSISGPMTEQRATEIKAVPWRPRRHLSPSQQLRREVNGLLNKLTIENFPILAEKLARIISDVKTKEDLETIVELVLDKAFNEPDFSELYADLCLVLSYRCSPTLNTSVPGKQSSLFSSLLIQKWREAFDNLPSTVELSDEQKMELSPEDQEILITKMKTRVRGLCISLAEFVIRRMVGMAGFNRTASVLLAREAPEEHYIEGICQMLSTAGAFLDIDQMGKSLVETCFGRLQELQAKSVCSKRINCLIQDLIDARKVDWHKKIHKEKAKGLSALKEEVENADLVGGSVVTAQYGTVVKLGQRSNLSNEIYAKYLNEQEQHYNQLKATTQSLPKHN